MAKSKHSAALFEVITRSKPVSRPYRPGVFSRIAALFRPASGVPATQYSSIAATEAPATTLLTSPPDDSPARPSHAPVVADSPLAGDAARPIFEVDSGRREIGLRLSYTSAAISAIVLITAITVAFMLGKKLGTPRPALADKTIDERLAQGVEANVLDVNARDDAAGANLASIAGIHDDMPGLSPTTRHARGREVGKNYIIVQSYPDRRTAEKAVTVLVQNGVDCTAEKSPSGWTNKSWWTVITLDGYDRISDNRAYDTQIRKIKSISDKFAKRNSFNAFDPTAYKWKAADGH